jgi:hypothetical protein
LADDKMKLMEDARKNLDDSYKYKRGRSRSAKVGKEGVAKRITGTERKEIRKTKEERKKAVSKQLEVYKYYQGNHLVWIFYAESR